MAHLRQDPYGFAVAFERAVVLYACTNPAFYKALAYRLEPGALSTPIAALALDTAHLYVTDQLKEKQQLRGRPTPITPAQRKRGLPPDSIALIVQRLSRRSQEEGRITHDQITAVLDYLESAYDDPGRPSVETVSLELTPILKRRLESSAVDKAIDAVHERKEFTETKDLLDEASQLGGPQELSSSEGLALASPTLLDKLTQLGNTPKLASGIYDLDIALGGGFALNSFAVVMAEPGGGKSMMLSHLAAEAILKGLFVLYATLEVSPPDVMARILANLTQIPMTDILHGAKERLEAQLGPCIDKLGPFEVEPFDPDSTQVGEIKSWVLQMEKEYNRTADVVVIDYADYLAFPDPKMHSYSGMKIIYRSLFAWAHQDKKLIFTASATKQKQNKKEVTGIDDASDSRYKLRVCDLMLAIDRKGEEGNEVLIHIGKNRTGQSKKVIGPLPCDWACGRFVALPRGDLLSYFRGGPPASAGEVLDGW